MIYNAGANTCSEQFLDGGERLCRVIDLNIGTMLALVQHFGGRCASGGVVAS